MTTETWRCDHCKKYNVIDREICWGCSSLRPLTRNEAAQAAIRLLEAARNQPEPEETWRERTTGFRPDLNYDPNSKPPTV